MLRFRSLFVSISLLASAFVTAPASVSFAQPLTGDPQIDFGLTPATHFHALWPTEGIITTYFGEVGPLSPRGHTGLDVAAAEGTPIVAADKGEVLKAVWDDSGYGGLIIIGHPSGYETWYAHLDDLEVETGKLVSRGQEIAKMGSTGFSTGPHLHFEVRQDGQLLDPLEFVSEATLKPDPN